MTLKPTMTMRDLTVWPLADEQWLVFATDNLVGIGELAFDQAQATPEEVGYFTARVALMELIASGATPMLLIDTMSGGDPKEEAYARRMLTGIREAVAEADLPPTFTITGSSEKNIVIPVTSLSLTVIGHVAPSAFRVGTSCVDDEVWLIGVPKSAPEDRVTREDTTIVSFSLLHELSSLACVHEIVPIGSRGAMAEAKTMAEIGQDLRFCPKNTEASLEERKFWTKSAGPATALLVAGTKLSQDQRFIQIAKQIPSVWLGDMEVSYEA